MNDNLRWRTPREFDLLWRTWDDDEYVVFHAGSGDTHLLNALAAEALETLDRSPLSAAELAGHLATCLARPVDDELHGAAEELIRQFDELGLIERAA